MNYYPFHLGDYTAHTAHLEPMEDLAYRRMLDLYYRTERPLPEPEEIARMIRLRDYAATIRDVLNEFFISTEDGYRHARCDAEIARMQDKQAQQAIKNEQETERMLRHRERRAQMFASLRECGIVPAWDVPMKELQRLVDETCNAPVRVAGALPETDQQRRSLPIPIPTPIPIPKKKTTPAPSGLPPLPEGVDSQTWADWLTLRKAKKAPVTATVIGAAASEAVKAGLSLDAFLRVWCARGSQGLEAAWLKPHERAGPPVETPFQQSRRENVAAFTGGLAARRTTKPEVIDDNANRLPSVR